MRIEKIKILKKLIEENEIESYCFETNFKEEIQSNIQGMSGEIILNIVTKKSNKLSIIISKQWFKDLNTNSLEYQQSKSASNIFKNKNDNTCVLILELMQKVKFYELVNINGVDFTKFKNIPRFIKKVVKESYKKSITNIEEDYQIIENIKNKSDFFVDFKENINNFFSKNLYINFNELGKFEKGDFLDSITSKRKSDSLPIHNVKLFSKDSLKNSLILQYQHPTEKLDNQFNEMEIKSMNLKEMIDFSNNKEKTKNKMFKLDNNTVVILKDITVKELNNIRKIEFEEA